MKEVLVKDEKGKRWLRKLIKRENKGEKRNKRRRKKEKERRKNEKKK